MCFKAVIWAYQQHVGNPLQKNVLVCLSNHANKSTELCYPSLDVICAETEYSRSAVIRAINAMVSSGLIERLIGGGRGRATVYRIPFKTVSDRHPLSINSVSQTPFNSETVSEGHPLAVKTVSEGHKTVSDRHPNHKEPKDLSVKERKENKQRKERKQYPAWLDISAWMDYQQHRKEIGKPLTPLAETKALNKLEAMTARGPPSQREVIDHTIANGWQGLFAPRMEGNGRDRPKSAVDRVREATERNKREREKRVIGERIFDP